MPKLTNVKRTDSGGYFTESGKRYQFRLQGDRVVSIWVATVQPTLVGKAVRDNRTHWRELMPRGNRARELIALLKEEGHV